VVLEGNRYHEAVVPDNFDAPRFFGRPVHNHLCRCDHLAAGPVASSVHAGDIGLDRSGVFSHHLGASAYCGLLVLQVSGEERGEKESRLPLTGEFKKASQIISK